MALVIGIIAFVAFLVGLIFIRTTLDNAKYRAKQQILQNTGFSSADINAGISNAFDKKHTEKFLQEHPVYTEETIKEKLKQYSIDLININQNADFSEDMLTKAQSDKKIAKLQPMQFKRANIQYYGKEKLNANIVYTDNRDEYNMYLYCSMINDDIHVDKYQIVKGAVVGF